MKAASSLCRCGHAPDFCHVRNAERWCGLGSEAKHICYVSDDPDGGDAGHYRPCPPALCQADGLLDLVRGLVGELEQRRACLVEARADLERIMGAGVQDGGLWIRAVAEARIPMLDGAIAETDKALIAAGGTDAA